MSLRRNKPLRRSPLKAKPSCTHPGCKGSTLCRRTDKPLKRSRLNPRNPERRAKRFEVQYGGSDYAEWINGHPCACCGVTGWTVAAHTETGGMGMKGEADTLVPLCGPRLGVPGCHYLLDEKPWELPEGTEMRLKALAKALRKRFLEREEEDDGVS